MWTVWMDNWGFALAAVAGLGTVLAVTLLGAWNIRADASGTHGDLVERGRKGVWVEPLLPGKHPLISRVGSMQNLVDHVLQPTVGNYFRNSAQQVSVLEFLSDRAELMKTQTDRKIAEELERTDDAQPEAQVKRQALQRGTSVADLQAEVVRCEQMVRVAKQNAIAAAETARGDSQAVQLRAEGDAAAVRMHGAAEAAALRATGAARADAYRLGAGALGSPSYTAVQVATILGEHKVKVVPDIAVSGESASGLASVLLARLVRSQGQAGDGTGDGFPEKGATS